MFEDLKEKVRHMRREHRRIGEILMQNPSLILYLNASELAKYLGVSPSSVVRFVKKLGFKGYPDFRRAVIERVGFNKTPLEFVQEAGSQIMNDIRTKELSAMEKSLTPEVISAINEASELLSVSDHVILVGYASAGVFAQLLYLFLSVTGLNISITTNSRVDFYAKIHMFEDQTIVVFSYLKHFKELVELLSRAKDMGHKVISITESQVNPVAMRSDINIPIWMERSGFLITLTPVAMAINLLVARVSELRQEDVKRILQKTKKMWENSDIFFGGE